MPSSLMLRGRLTALSAAFAALALVGCGGGNGGGQASGTHAAPGGGSTGGGTSGSRIGRRRLPQAPTARPRPADAASLRVIRGWSDALRRGQVNRATDYFALPSVVQNTSPPVELEGAPDARAFNRSLPCGARLQRAYRIGGYTAAVFVLTERPGGDCGTGAGNRGGHGVRHQARQDRRVAASRRPADRGRGTATDRTGHADHTDGDGPDRLVGGVPRIARIPEPPARSCGSCSRSSTRSRARAR